MNADHVAPRFWKPQIYPLGGMVLFNVCNLRLVRVAYSLVAINFAQTDQNTYAMFDFKCLEFLLGLYFALFTLCLHFLVNDSVYTLTRKPDVIK